MTHIKIENIGPIKKIELDLNKINIFMGPQSSGKSTIAKIISYCSWYEKNTILGTKPNIDFYKELLEFHNFEDNYFCDESLIEYKSPNYHIVFKGDSRKLISEKIDVDFANIFQNKKIEYIPAERNIVSIPGIGKYTESKNNILNFLYDWFRAKREKKENNRYKLPLESLNGVSYYYIQEDDIDKLILENGKEIRLQHASSGLMSVTPLLMVFNHVINEIYSEKRILSPFETINIESKVELFDKDIRNEIIKIIDLQKRNESIINNLKKKLSDIGSLPQDANYKEEEHSIIKDISYIEEQLNLSQKEIIKLIGYDANYSYTKVIIEEPELNLFPKTQQDLVYYMVEELVKENREHQLVITTHSPYILFALNNCMMGGLVDKNIPNEEKESFASYKSWINPKCVSIYEIHDGELKCIQDEDGILEDNYLNKAYKENSSEYLSLLNYFDDEE